MKGARTKAARVAGAGATRAGDQRRGEGAGHSAWPPPAAIDSQRASTIVLLSKATREGFDGTPCKPSGRMGSDEQRNDPRSWPDRIPGRITGPRASVSTLGMDDAGCGISIRQKRAACRSGRLCVADRRRTAAHCFAAAWAGAEGERLAIYAAFARGGVVRMSQSLSISGILAVSAITMTPSQYSTGMRLPSFHWPTRTAVQSVRPSATALFPPRASMRPR